MDYISSHDDVSINNSFIKTFHSLPTKSKPTASAVLSSTCKGCTNVFQRLLIHLSGKKAQQCRAKYTEEEIEGHKKAKKTNVKENIKDVVTTQDDSNNNIKTVLNITYVVKKIITDIFTIEDVPCSDEIILNESEDVADKTHEDDLNVLSSICRGCSK